MEELARLLREGGWSSVHGYKPGKTVLPLTVGGKMIEKGSPFSRLILVPREELGVKLPREEVMRLVREHTHDYLRTVEEATGGRRDGVIVTDYESSETSPARRLSKAIMKIYWEERKRLEKGDETGTRTN